MLNNLAQSLKSLQLAIGGPFGLVQIKEIFYKKNLVQSNIPKKEE